MVGIDDPLPRKDSPPLPTTYNSQTNYLDDFNVILHERGMSVKYSEISKADCVHSFKRLLIHTQSKYGRVVMIITGLDESRDTKSLLVFNGRVIWCPYYENIASLDPFTEYRMTKNSEWSYWKCEVLVPYTGRINKNPYRPITLN